MLNNLKSAAKRDAGKAKAEKMVRITLKIALKAKLMYDNKLITEADARELIGPVNEMVSKLHEGLEMDSKMPVHLISLIHAKFDVVEGLVCKLVKKHMTPKNIQKMRDVFAYFGSVRFLDLLLNDDKYSTEREAVEQSVGVLVQPLLDERQQMEAVCTKIDCYNTNVPAQGKFRGTGLCAMHHTEVRARQLKNPDVIHFITEEGKLYKPFVQMSAKYFPAESGDLVRAISNFQNAAENVRQLFAEALYEKYLDPNSHQCVKTSEAVLAGIKKRIDAHDVDTGVFDPAFNEHKAPMDKFFMEHFKQSKEYQHYMNTIELPKSARREASAQLKTAAKAAKEAAKEK